jgi:hypothetical protein
MVEVLAEPQKVDLVATKPPERTEAGDQAYSADIGPRRLSGHEASANDIQTLKHPDRAESGYDDRNDAAQKFHVFSRAPGPI